MVKLTQVMRGVWCVCCTTHGHRYVFSGSHVSPCFSRHGSRHTPQKRGVTWAGQALKPVGLFRQDEKAAAVLDPCGTLTKACQIHFIKTPGNCVSLWKRGIIWPL